MVWIGTGFLFGRFKRRIDVNQKEYTIFVITNKHVLEGYKGIFLKFNSATDATSKDYQVDLVARNGKKLWVGHPSADVAAIPINAGTLRNELRKYAFVQSDCNTMLTQALKEEGATEGDGIFVLGFPMGLVNPERQYAICRRGAIARIRDLFEGKATEFLVDATVFPGNSGGPVFIHPEPVSIVGTKPINRAALIGIVKSYVPYQDVAVSQQTGVARIAFQENSGLAAVEPVDHIEETVNLAMRRVKNRLAKSKWKAKRVAKQGLHNSISELPCGVESQRII